MSSTLKLVGFSALLKDTSVGLLGLLARGFLTLASHTETLWYTNIHKQQIKAKYFQSAKSVQTCWQLSILAPNGGCIMNNAYYNLSMKYIYRSLQETMQYVLVKCCNWRASQSKYRVTNRVIMCRICLDFFLDFLFSQASFTPPLCWLFHCRESHPCCNGHSIHHWVEIFQHFCSGSSVMSVSDHTIQSILIYLKGYSVKIYQSYSGSSISSSVQFEKLVMYL